MQPAARMQLVPECSLYQNAACTKIQPATRMQPVPDIRMQPVPELRMATRSDLQMSAQLEMDCVQRCVRTTGQRNCDDAIVLMIVRNVASPKINIGTL